MNEEQLESKFSELRELMLAQATRTENLSEQLTGQSGRIDGLTDRFDGLSDRFDGLSEQFGELSARTDGLAEKLDQGLAAQAARTDKLAEQMRHGFDAVYRRFDKVDERLEVLEERTAGIELVVEGIDKKVDALTDGQRDTERRLDRWHGLTAQKLGLKLHS